MHDALSASYMAVYSLDLREGTRWEGMEKELKGIRSDEDNGILMKLLERYRPVPSMSLVEYTICITMLISSR